MNSPLSPSQDVLEAFTVDVEPVLLKGGMGRTWRAGNIVLKPINNDDETSWSANLIETLPQDSFRIARYKKTKHNDWTYDNWCALEFIKGEHKKDHWKEKINVCRGFNELLVSVEKPDFIEKRTDPWAIAGKMVWDELPLQFDERLSSYIEQIKRYLEPFPSKNQIIHGDITGNMLFADTLPPGIIDFTPIWRPKEYALAILIVDAITWERADLSIFSYVEDEENMFQFLLRAALFRTLDMSEFYRQFSIDRFSELPQHERVLSIIVDHYKTS